MENILYESIRRLEDSNWWFVGMRSIAKSLMRELPAFERALDLGCGSGGNVGLLNEVSKEVYAVDLSDRALAFARERLNAGEALEGLLAGDAERLPVKSASVDLVWAFNVIEHVPDDRAAFAEVSRVLKPGGWAVVATSASPSLWSDHDVANHHHRRYRASELRQKLTAAGLEPCRLTHANAALFAPTALVAAAQRVRARWWGRPRYERNAVEVSKRIDRFLLAMLEAEAKWLTRHDLPIGVSIFALAQKP